LLESVRRVKAIENCTAFRKVKQEIDVGCTAVGPGMLTTPWIAAVMQALLASHVNEGLSMYNWTVPEGGGGGGGEVEGGGGGGKGGEGEGGEGLGGKGGAGGGGGGETGGGGGAGGGDGQLPSTPVNTVVVDGTTAGPPGEVYKI